MPIVWWGRIHMALFLSNAMVFQNPMDSPGGFPYRARAGFGVSKVGVWESNH